jgi:hypothetical protein
MSGFAANPFITNIVPLFNVSTSPGGSANVVDYSSQITGLLSIIDYANYIVSTDIIQGQTGTQVIINSDLAIIGNVTINNIPIGPDSLGSNFTSGTSFTVQTSNVLEPNVQFIVNNSNAFTIDQNANSIFSGTITCQNVTQVSDKRLKSNITSLSNCLSTVIELNAVHYTLHGKENTSLGFIAQDLHEVLPTIVNTSTFYWSIDYTQIIPLLVESVKELAAEVKLLRAERV